MTADIRWEEFSFAGMQRRFGLALPLTRGSTVPLVVALHGGLQPAEGLAASTGLASDGPARGFAVAFPEGFRRAWNAGRCCGAAARLRVDDVGS